MKSEVRFIKAMILSLGSPVLDHLGLLSHTWLDLDKLFLSRRHRLHSSLRRSCDGTNLGSQYVACPSLC
jgi:hypothetical protein